MSNNIDIKEFKLNLAKINKSGKVLLNDLDELYEIVKYIKLYKKRGFKINNILSIVNNNIYNTEQYLIKVIKETTKMSIIIQENTNIINKNNIMNSNLIPISYNISITSNNISSNDNNISSNDNNSIIHISQKNIDINTDIISDSNDISESSSSSSQKKQKCCDCFKL